MGLNRRGRKRRYIDGGKPRTFYCPTELNILLDSIPNASEFVVNALQIAFGCAGIEELERQNITLNKEIAATKNLLCDLERRVAEVSHQRMMILEQQAKQADLRLALLEKTKGYLRSRATMRDKPRIDDSYSRAWLEGQMQEISIAGFKGIDDFVQYVTKVSK